MKEQIVIVGMGDDRVGKILLHQAHNDFGLVTPEEIKQLPFPKSEPFILRNTYPLKAYGEDSQFSCKGKHQYKRVVKNNLVEWVCQCGRKTTD